MSEKIRQQSVLERTPAAEEGEPWMILRTAPRFIDTLAEMAADAGVRIWWPVYARRTRVGPSKKRTVVYKPIFPGYGFVPRSHVERLAHVPTHRYQLLRMLNLWDYEWMKLPAKKIAELADEEEAACRLEREPKPVDRFQVGDWVQPDCNLFGPMQVRGFVGKRLLLESGHGHEIHVAADAAQKVADDGLHDRY